MKSLETRSQQWLNKVKKLHKGFYDYSEVDYLNSRTKVTIICPIHGVFKQTPGKHANKHGCPECGKLKISNIKSKWTESQIRCLLNANKYSSVSEFKENNIKEYGACLRRFKYLIDEFFPNRIKPYTEKDIKKEALKYKYRSDFIRNSPTIYNAARRKDILDEVCKHMVPKGNGYDKHKIYVYEFEDNFCYIGQTRQSIKDRDKDHFRKDKNSPVRSHSLIFPYYTLYVLEEDIPEKTIHEREDYWKKYYLKRGWSPLWNIKVVDRSLGGISSITNDEIFQRASRFNKRSQFRREDPTAYNAAIKRGILKDVCSHIKCNGAAKKPVKDLLTGKVFESKSEASRVLGITNIEKVCRGELQQSKGHVLVWCDEDKDIIKQRLRLQNAMIKGNIKKITTNRPIKGRKVGRSQWVNFKSIRAASKYIQGGSIGNVLSGRQKYTKGWEFRYIDKPTSYIRY